MVRNPTDLVAAAMLRADVIFRATTFSLSHSKARANACAAGARDLNCCDYDVLMLESEVFTQILKQIVICRSDCKGF